MANQVVMGRREWLALSLVPRLGCSRIYSLYRQRLRWPEEWMIQLGLSQRHYLAYLLDHTAGRAQLDAILQWCDESRQHYLLYPGHPAWPSLLAEIPDPPILLWAWGNIDVLKSPGLAMVGSRQASNRGLRHAESFAHTLAAKGLCIISGMALGIDAAAHRGALNTGGKTLAVLGCGIDILYPRRNAGLHQQILAEGGLVVSEFAPGTKAYPQFFPRRNRIITGLSKGVLVVEAAHQSGSLISARLALEQNRDVFALPGNPDDVGMAGCLWLIQQGAMLVTQPQEILEAMTITCNSSPATLDCVTLPATGALTHPLTHPLTTGTWNTADDLLSGLQQDDTVPDNVMNTSARILDDRIEQGEIEHGETAACLYNQLSASPIGVDELMSQTDIVYQDCLMALLELELVGEVRRVPGGWVIVAS